MDAQEAGMARGSDGAGATQSHLLVHAGSRSPSAPRESLLERLRRSLAGAAPRRHAAIHLRVEDLQGRRVIELEPLEPRIDIPLEPGTYHVTACQGTVTRRYTLTLEAARTHDLHLRLAGP